MLRINAEIDFPSRRLISGFQKKLGKSEYGGGIIIKLFFAITLLHFSTVVQAQVAGKELTLEAAIQAAIENNKDVSFSEFDEKIARARYERADAIFLPQISLAYTAMVTDNPLNAFGVRLQQRSIEQSDFNPALLNHPSGTWDFATEIKLQQPLINFDRFYERKSAFKQTELHQLKTRRTKEFVVFQVTQAYLQLQLAWEAKRVTEEAEQTVKAILKMTSDRYNQGMLQKSDVLNVEVKVKMAESHVADAVSNIRNASDYLSLLMDGSPGVIYQTEMLSLKSTEKSLFEVVPEDRADFRAMEMAIQSYDMMIKSKRTSYLPRLNAFATYQFNDSQALGFGADAYLAGVQLSWDIFKGNTTKKDIAIQSLERDKLNTELSKQKAEGNAELEKAQRQLSDSRFKLVQQRLAVELAEESLRILQNRYAQGLVNTTDVLAAQMQLSQQQLMYRQTVFDVSVTTAFVQFLTSK